MCALMRPGRETTDGPHALAPKLLTQKIAAERNRTPPEAVPPTLRAPQQADDTQAGEKLMCLRLGDVELRGDGSHAPFWLIGEQIKQASGPLYGTEHLSAFPVCDGAR